jgi:hypothetical protein
MLLSKSLHPCTKGPILRTALRFDSIDFVTIYIVVTLNPKSATEIINKLPDNLNGPVLPYRMISF